MRRGIRDRMQIAMMTEEDWRELRAVCYGMCARVDHHLGRFLEDLSDAGLYGDTALFFFSDHGEYAGDFDMVEKAQNTFEDCLTRAPLTIKPPEGIPVVSGVRDSLVELIDVGATVYALSGIVPACADILHEMERRMLDWYIRHHPESAHWQIGEIMREARDRWDVPPQATLRALRQALALDGELTQQQREIYFSLLAPREDLG